jgi:hypothetical protein
MDEPVLIYSGGHLVHRGIARRSLDLMLQEAKKEGDLAKLFWGEITIPVR